MGVKVVKVILKGGGESDDWTFTKKYLIYDKLLLDEEDKECKECLDDAKNHLNPLVATIEKVELRPSMIIQ
jgi:hypothetical protein